MANSRHRAWVYTLNNYSEDDVAQAQSVECVFHIFGRERGALGTSHLQGFIYFAEGKTLSTVRRLYDGRAHWEPKSKHSTFAQCVDYCKKEGDFVERGVCPQDQDSRGKRGGDAERERWDRALHSAREGAFENIPADIYVRYHGNIRRIAQESAPSPPRLDERAYYGIWIWGEPRTGKSHAVRELGVPIYFKDINKWWCDYKGEPVVCIDEFDPKHADFMVAFIKKWVDRWPFSAETKGGRKVFRPQWVVVTSNHPLYNCFSGVDGDAISARFLVLHKTSKEQDLNLRTVMNFQ